MLRHENVVTSQGHLINRLFFSTGEKLDVKHCETLEEVFKRVQFRMLDLEASNLTDDVSINHKTDFKTDILLFLMLSKSSNYLDPIAALYYCNWKFTIQMHQFQFWNFNIKNEIWSVDGKSSIFKVYVTFHLFTDFTELVFCNETCEA